MKKKNTRQGQQTGAALRTDATHIMHGCSCGLNCLTKEHTVINLITSFDRGLFQMRSYLITEVTRDWGMQYS